MLLLNLHHCPLSSCLQPCNLVFDRVFHLNRSLTQTMLMAAPTHEPTANFLCSFRAAMCRNCCSECNVARQSQPACVVHGRCCHSATAMHAACHMGGRPCIACALSLSFSPIVHAASAHVAALAAEPRVCANAASSIATEHYFCAFSSDKCDKRKRFKLCTCTGIGCNGLLRATPAAH